MISRRAPKQTTGDRTEDAAAAVAWARPAILMPPTILSHFIATIVIHARPTIRDRRERGSIPAIMTLRIGAGRIHRYRDRARSKQDSERRS